METLLQIKLKVPQARSGIVARPRLMNKLNAGRDSSLILISAPAGYGKTTVTTEWLQSLQADVAWLALDEGDDDPRRFLSYLLAAFRQLQPEIGTSIEEMLNSPELPSPDELITWLLGEWNTTSSNRFLVLDDYHVITHLAIHNALNALLAYLPSSLHLVVLTRADPPLPLARLRVRNELTEIRASDLRFTALEAGLFLSQTMGLSLSDEQVTSLETRTEGWVAGLQLAALSMQGRDDVETFVTTFTGSHHYVLDYLVDEVLNRQPETTRDFLLKTSILERMNASLCNALTGEENSSIVLVEMHRANLFVSALDDEHHWFQYHPLFGDVLQNRLQHAYASAVPQLHRKAALWFETNGFLPEAIAHAQASQDLEFAAQMVDRNSAFMLMSGDMRTLLRWMDAIDPVLHQNASLCIAKAWAQAFTNRPEGMDDLLIETETRIAGDDSHPLHGDIAALHAYLAGVRGQAIEAIQFGRQALDLIPESNLIVRGVTCLTLGGAFWSHGDWDESAAMFEQAARIGRRVGSSHLVSTALCGLANHSFARGDLQRARDYCEQALQVSTGKNGKYLPTSAEACLILGNLYYEWNDLPAAETFFNEGIRLVRLLGRTSTLADGQVSLARLRQAQGKWEQADGLLQEAESHQQSSILYPAVDAHLVSTKLEFFLRRGNLTSAERLVQQRGYSNQQPITYINSQEYIAFGHFLLVSKAIDQANILAGNLIDLAEVNGWNDLLIRAQILRAMILAAQGQLPQAIKSLAQALSLASPQGYMRAFLDPGSALQSILHQMKQEVGLQDTVLKLLAAFGEILAKPAQPLLEPLSERELEVLRLVASGMSNRQIAEELVLATGTVKRHLNNIFGKMDVKNRTECVARAREMKLL